MVTIENNQNGELSFQRVMTQFMEDAHAWTLAAKSNIQDPGYLSEIKISRTFVEWIKPIVTIREEKDLDGTVIRTVVDTKNRQSSYWDKRLRLQRDSNIGESHFEPDAEEAALCILRAGDLPFGLRYKIKGSVVQGRDPSILYRTIVRLGDKTSEEITAELDKLGFNPVADSDSDSDSEGYASTASDEA